MSIFLDFYVENGLNKLFWESKNKDKWRKHRKTPLNQLIEGVYSRTITEEALKKRTKLTYEKKKKRIIEEHEMLKMNLTSTSSK